MVASIRAHKGVRPVVHDSVFVDATALVIGDVHIGADSSVWPYAVVRGDMHRIRIGERVSVQDGSVLHITHASRYHPDGFPLTIGNDVTIGHQATLHGCSVHDRVLIGMKAMVMDGAVIESEVILGAGAWCRRARCWPRASSIWAIRRRPCAPSPTASAAISPTPPRTMRD